MASYNTQQITFVFSLVSNAAASAEAGQSDLPGLITAKFQTITQQYGSYIGTGWSMPWGPVVESSPTARGPVANNSLIVVQGTDAGGNPLYIVATAGTNPKSAVDRTEDLNLTMVPFAAGGNIDQGTMTGLNALLTMQSNGLTLQQFLKSRASSSATLAFTGHSLGGALTPALALSVDTTGWGNVVAMPTAGPTPGDAGFVAAFTQKFPPLLAQGGTTLTWNRNVVNELDAVPMAWTSIAQVNGLYPQIGDPPCVQALVDKFAALPLSPNPFVNLPQSPFTGQYGNPPVPPLYAKNLTVRFLAQALYQHIQAYVVQLVPDLVNAFNQLTLSAEDCAGLAAWCLLHAAETVPVAAGAQP
jgi:hypothetical protein